ncbi:MAG: type II toxin-antitoxin system YafQ family toxin [Candidatus Azambacteria bacterium]|nr:type II toxin-antitoxin system YafQ family toxin [Candidatus Azambacteria bacterium]
MHLIHPTKNYEKSYLKLLKSGAKKKVFDDIALVIDILACGEVLDAKYRDHKLQGDYTGYRECHIRADLLLVYQIREGALVLVLVDIGTHAYLFE